MISDLKPPKTKNDLVKSIQTVPRMGFEVIEVKSYKDKPKVHRSLDKMVSRGPVSVIIVQEK